MKAKTPISGPINLKGKIAIVTGGARGIGQAICLALAREHAVVNACDILPFSKGKNIFGMKCDVTKINEVMRIKKEVIKRFGRIDILVTNAAILGDTTKQLEEISEDEWDNILKVNLKGTFNFCKAILPVMKKQRSGKIICLGSIAGRAGGILSGPHYCASKGGIHALIRWMAKNGAPYGICVNGIAPGPIITPMTEKMVRAKLYKEEIVPLGRLGHPQDIAEAVVFFSSDASNFITGAILDVNGGMLMT